MKKANRNNSAALASLRKKTETLASGGLLLVMAALTATVLTPDKLGWLLAYKIVYALGALLYTAARFVNVNAPDDTLRVRRIRRMEIWAGVAFLAGAFFWFYNTWNMPEGAFLTVTAMRDTIMFTFAGAIIQIVASALLGVALKKQAAGKQTAAEKLKKRK